MKNKITTVVFSIVMLGVSLVALLKPADDFSQSERRPLSQMPEVSVQSVMNGDFMEDFEKYSTDQFPMRDALRRVKAGFSFNVLRKKDNNGLFLADGHVSKIDDDENEYMINYAAELFKKITDANMKDKNCNIYLSVIPDKNFILADKNGYPSMDYDKFIEKVKNKNGYMEYIDITDYLSIDDYYTTDTHWRQEKITDIASQLAERMGTKIPEEYTLNKLDNPFYGVYAGQIALKVEPDEIIYLTNSVIDGFVATYYGTGAEKPGEVYNMEKAYGKDPYEMFLSGSEPLVVIENPLADNDRELVVFRDSYASSLVPLIAQGYKKTTLIDLRYMQSGYIGSFVDFDSCDVLFIYSTAVLNISTSMR